MGELVLMRATVTMLVVAALGGCLRSTEFPCSDSTQCGGGVCQPVGYCSFDDSGCPSGQRFGESAGTYAGQCVVGGVNDAGVVDAPVDTAALCPSSYAAVAGGPTNRVYRAINVPATWGAQRTACAADGANAYLAIPDDAAELMAIDTLVNVGDYWIGVNDVATEGTYLNVKDEVQAFLPWDADQPNNTNNSDCVEVDENNQMWNDTMCGTAQPAICECEL
ncbi:MAG: C-type lectin domain-containing protein [Kofleriaceae bacterium]